MTSHAQRTDLRRAVEDAADRLCVMMRRDLPAIPAAGLPVG